jgi:putative choline sulfate-utilization transcription factor
MANLGRLPPLQTLVVFDAAARHLNFTAAAQELGTTQPAVSQRIGLLEDDLGAPLFARAHRGVRLTPDGALLFSAVQQSLAGIGDAVAKIRTRRTRQVLTIATDFGFATYWLMPRLAALRQLAPHLDVRIVTSQNEFDIRGEAVDVAIAFGAGPWPGCSAEALFPELVVPVCSPGFLAEHGLRGAPDELARLPLLHLETALPARWLSWANWFELHQLAATDDTHDLTLNNYALVIQAAIAGQGVALGWLPLIDEQVRAGQLARAVDRPVSTERGYYLVQPHAQRSPESLSRFRHWIIVECAGASTAPAPRPLS